MSTHSTSPSTRRVVQPTPPSRTPRDWPSGVLAGVQAALYGYLCVLIPTMAVFVAAAADSSRESWLSAAQVGTDIWLLGNGGHIAVGSGTSAATVAFTPLGLVALGLVLCAFTFRRRPWHTWGSFGAAVLTYTAALTLVGATIGGAPGRSGLLFTALGAAIVSAIGCYWGMRKDPDAPSLAAEIARWVELPDWLMVGLRAGGWAVLATLAAALVLTIVWIVTGWGRIAGIAGSLNFDGLGAIALTIAQLLVLPNLVGWALGYLTGPGFALGAGTEFSPFAVSAGPMPAMPILGAVPEPPGGGLLPLLLAVPVLAAIAAGYRTLRRRRAQFAANWVWWQRVMIAPVGGLTAGVCCALVAWVCGGSIGPGAMATIGPDPLALFALAAVEVTLGGLIAVGSAALVSRFGRAAATT